MRDEYMETSKRDYFWIDAGEGIQLKLTRNGNENPPILDWENLTDNDGNPIPYSKEKAFELLDTEKYFAMFIYEETGYRRLLDNTDLFGS
jgi:hypothetical protein